MTEAKMQPAALADRLDSSGDVIYRSVLGVDDRQLRWKPAPEKWSILEVLVHLVEEEQLDFRPRLASTLEDPSRPWPPIDPEAWAKERRYNERDPAEALAEWRRERSASTEWLRGLVSPAWDNAYHHPMAKIRAGDLMVSWLAHDQIHIRQIAHLKVLWLAERKAPYSTRYAMP